MKLDDLNIAIVGLGYVGLPLAIEFGKKRNTLGFDIDKSRIDSLKNFFDETNEVALKEFNEAKNLVFSSNPDDLFKSNCFIVTVPTPITEDKKPDLLPLISATELITKFLKKGDIVIYESTVFPGATEEICVPIIEKNTGFKLNIDFTVGYSPERINPGDRDHGVKDIVKVTSGSTNEAALIINKLYESIISAGTHMASSIRVAEAAKVIENTQRDVNIGLINELSMIFNILDINTNDVLEAAGTKWNFLNFKPGIVGGHCIGVDPYYLTYKAESVGYTPQIILAGRAVNDNMSSHIVTVLIKDMLSKGISIQNSNILILGLSFKENCPDIRNSKVIDIANELDVLGAIIDCYDPIVNSQKIQSDLSWSITDEPKKHFYDGIIIAVAHDVFKLMSAEDIYSFGKKTCSIFDIKSIFPLQDKFLKL
jgi:UDP-N-acetyl-D-glucosamine/UDP-N-acetyl-D-galactosamine dehydrogenase